MFYVMSNTSLYSKYKKCTIFFFGYFKLPLYLPIVRVLFLENRFITIN